MRVHHLNCGSLRTVTPIEGSLIEGSLIEGSLIEGSLSPERAVCHCLLIETDTDGLVLVETGFGLTDIEHPRESLGDAFIAFAEPVLDPEETAIRQVARLGFSPADIRHIVLTHLHRDHTGGLPDFPHATVHLHEAEYRAVTDPDAEHHRHSLDRFMEAHRAHGPRWAPSQQCAPWFGMDAARLQGLPDDILLIPLAGHTPGHSGIAVQLEDRWLLHVGDAYFYHGEIAADPPISHPELDLIQENAQVDRDLRLDSLRRLRALHRRHGNEIEIFSAHDPWEFQRYT